jgi:AcrR family transcriptional regulator
VIRNPNSGSKSASPRRERRAEARRLDILRAAARVFRQRGFAGAGMREIAAEADLSPANLYHYFGSKQEILFFCQDRSLDRLLGNLERARRSRASLPDRLREVARAHVLCLLDEIEGSAAHLALDGLPQTLARRLAAKRDRYERGIRELVERGIRRGELAPFDPALVTRAILGALNWTAGWYRPEGPKPASEIASHLAAYLVRGLERKPSPEARPAKRLPGGSP